MLPTEYTSLIQQNVSTFVPPELNDHHPVTITAYDINTTTQFYERLKEVIDRVPFGKYVEIEIIFEEKVTKEQGLILFARLPLGDIYQINAAHEGDFEEYMDKIKHAIYSSTLVEHSKFHYYAKPTTKIQDANLLYQSKLYPFMYDSESLNLYYDLKNADISHKILKKLVSGEEDCIIS